MMWMYLLLLCAWVCESYPNGRVLSGCADMVPSHIGARAQTKPAPYSITTDKTSYKKGDTITVTLSASSGKTFKGFLLKAHHPGEKSFLGSFKLVNPTAQLLNCSERSNSAISHTSDNAKTQIQSYWTAPLSNNLSDIEFIATVVQDFNTFWVGVRSEQIFYTGDIMVPPFTNISNLGCGSIKTCISQPSNCNPAKDSSCYFMSVAPTGSTLKFKYEVSGPVDSCISIGFSADKEVGNDDTYISVKKKNGVIQLQHLFLNGTNTNIMEGDMNLLTAFERDGVISYTFTSRYSISTSRRSFPSNSYYLFLAYDCSTNGTIQRHTALFYRPAKVNPFTPQQLELNEANKNHVFGKAHGCLMLIAWMFLGSIGMLIACFLKRNTVPKKIYGKDIWFVAHILLMVLSVVATSIAFILVFAHRRGWSGGAHSVLGCLVMILSFFQPIATVFRCSPQHERRFIFNWAHAMNALAIKGLAVAAIFTGLMWVDRSETLWLVKVMGGFVAWEALLYLCQQFNYKQKEKDMNQENYGGMSSGVILLLIFTLGNLVFLVALLVGIGKA